MAPESALSWLARDDLPPGPLAPPRFSKTCGGADVTFKSSDSVLFEIHSKNLEVATGAFPTMEGLNSARKRVPLTESADVLELLFQYVYPQRHPDLQNVDFSLVHNLAEAAEKYKVFPAMNGCRGRMREFVPEHAIEVCLFAAKHGYSDLINLTARHVIFLPLSKVLPHLPPQLTLPWVQYHEEVMKVYQDCFIFETNEHRVLRRQYRPASTPYPETLCEKWSEPSRQVLFRLRTGLGVFSSLDALFEPPDTQIPQECCMLALKTWKRWVESRLKALPDFESFVRSNLNLSEER